MVRHHLHTCPDCGEPWSCRGSHCSSWQDETCPECSPGEPPEERVAMGLTDQGRGSGCYRRVPAPGAE